MSTPLSSVREHLVVIGNGMAGCRAVEEILARDPDRFRITIFGAEPRVNYNRIMLSPVLAGEKVFEDIIINDQAWYDDNAIELIAGDPVVTIDREARLVTARSGRAVSYDKLMLATGSDPCFGPMTSQSRAIPSGRSSKRRPAVLPANLRRWKRLTNLRRSRKSS